MADEFIFTMQKVSKTYPPNREVLKDVTLAFLPGAKIGVIGINGAGKSSLLRLMAGRDSEYQGTAWLAEGRTVGLLEQEPHLDESRTVRENVEDGLAQVRDALQRFNEVSEAMADPEADFDALLSEQAELQQVIDALDGWNIDTRLDIAMNALRVPPGDWSVTNLSGGEKRRVALCRLLLSQPDLLLLDEPTNHLDAESVQWLEQHLARYPGTVVAITHDRYFLDNVAEWILELDRGRALPFHGNYSAWLEHKAERLAQEERADTAREKVLARELEWIRQSPKARHAKSKARIQRYEELAGQEGAEQRRNAVVTIPLSRRLGGRVVEFDGVSKGFDDKLLFEDLTFTLPPGGIVGVIGPNGAGKTTLMRLVVGQETPDAGEVRLGETVDLGYVDQSRDALQGDRTVWDEISDGHDLLTIGDREVNSRAYVSQFNFRGADQQKKVGDLSGGERNRVHLAKLLRQGCNLLLLDEPTNDLDVDTLRALEAALLDFPGCAVITSHDRFFLDRIATHILAFEGDSQVTWFEGNFDQYEAHRKATLGEAAMQPKRITYRPLVRS